MSFFKGFVRTKNKKCLEKFKNTELRTFDEVKDFPEYAGILAEDAVLIDIDDKDNAEKLLNIIETEGVLCQVRETTRGMHFFFKNDGGFERCGTGVTLALGMKADIKVGIKASYSILKFDGKEREVIYDILEGEAYAVPPVWLRVVHTNIDLAGVEEGEGRNEKLFRYIMPLQSAGFSKDDIRETLRIVNRWMFDKPLSKSEFDTITRDEAFETALIPSFFGEKNRFLHDVMARHIISELKIKRVNGQLHMYKDGAYVPAVKYLPQFTLELVKDLTKHMRNEVVSYVEDAVPCENVEVAPAECLAFKNGILNIKTGEMVPCSPDIVITNQIPHNYRKNAYSEVVDKTLTKMACGKSDVRATMEEMVGYCFFRRNELRKAFILTGEKRNGKSTFISMLQKMLGQNNYSTLDLNEVGDRFRGASLAGKLANLGDDISSEFIKDLSQFKKLVSGEPMVGEIKGKDPFVFQNYAKFIFSANDIPRTRDKTGAVTDRLVIIPFDATFSPDDPDFDPFIKDKLCTDEAIEYLIKLGVDALRRVLARKRFTESKEGAEMIEEVHRINNPILDFLDDYETDELTREPTQYWYEKYMAYCVNGGVQPMAKNMFGREVRKNRPELMIKARRVNGKLTKFFIKCVTSTPQNDTVE